MRDGRPVGERKVQFRLRDWGISRQRYWGCPIPVIHCDACGVVPVPIADLPVTLPEDVSFDVPGNPLDRHAAWRQVPCPQCGAAGAARDRHHGHLRRLVLVLRALHRPAARGRADRPLRRRPLAAGRPVHRRHRARDPAPPLFALLHARDEPHRPFRREGRRALRRAVHARHGGARDLSGRRTAHGCCRPRSGSSSDGGARRAVHGTTGAPIEIGPIEKMSKSKKNTVDPDDIIASFGADTARWFMLSDSPPERDVIWTEEGVQGAARFVQRVWRLVGEIADAVGNGARRRTAAPRGRAGSARHPQGRAPRARRGRGGHRGPPLQRRGGEDLRARQRAAGAPRRHARTRPVGTRPGASARRPRSSCSFSPR